MANIPNKSFRTVVVSFVLLLLVISASAVAEDKILGSSCMAPPRVVCIEGGCADQFAPKGEAVDPKTQRNFFLDFPCDYKPGEKVTFILSLHGGGSIGNWQRHYFPAVDYVNKYRLVVATPSGVVRAWQADNDDEHLHNIVNLVYEKFGKENIKAFWLAGHSQGGMTSNRLVCTDFFKDKVDGWLSLSGGRIGPAKVPASFGGRAAPNNSSQATSGQRNSSESNANQNQAPTPQASPNTPRAGAAATPTCDINYIFATGELEIESLPDTSPWAEKYHCAVRERRADIVDTKPGYVTATDQSRGPAWGRHARPGTAQVYVYPNCEDSKLVADVLRLDKGHTEGLEPNVTEEIIKMMLAAPGGKALAGG